MADRCLALFTGICTPDGDPLTGYVDVDTGERTFYSTTGLYLGEIVSCNPDDGGAGTGDPGCCNSGIDLDLDGANLTVTVNQSDGPTVSDTVTIPAAVVDDTIDCNALQETAGGLASFDTVTPSWTYISDDDVCPPLTLDICAIDTYIIPEDACLVEAHISVPAENDLTYTPIVPSTGITRWQIRTNTGLTLTTLDFPAGTSRINVPLNVPVPKGICIYPVLTNVPATPPIAPTIELVLRLEEH